MPAGDREQAPISAIHAELRARILAGTLPPGAPISQVRLADELGVGRTPLREALRMLQEEGLIIAEHNRRMRVVGLDVEQLEAVSASRILFESLGLSLSVPFFTHADVAQMFELMDEMRGAIGDGDVERWESRHQRLHRLFFSHAPVHLMPSLERFFASGERFRRLYQRVHGQNPRTWSLAEAEHLGIVEACRVGDPVLARQRLAAHLSTSALALCRDLEPARTPTCVTTAIDFVLGDRAGGGEALPGVHTAFGTPARSRAPGD